MIEKLLILKQYASFFFIGTLLLLLTACSPEKSPEESVIAAKLRIENKQWSSALIHLKSALSVHNTSSLVSENEIRFLLGKVYLRQGDMPPAERFLFPVISAGFQLERSLPLYTRALFHQEKFELLNTTIERFQGQNPELDTELSLYKVLLLHKTGKKNLARDLLAVVSEQTLFSAFGLFTQAYTTASESPTRALALLEDLFSLAPNYVDGYLLKGHLSFAEKDFNIAYSAFKQYLSVQPSAYHVHFLLAMAALQLGKMDTMQDHVTTLLRINKNHPLANHLQALLAFKTQDYQAAKAHAVTSMTFGLTLPTNHLIAGVSALNLEQDQQAYQHLIKAANAMPQNNQVRKILMLIQFKLGYLQEAAENFDRLELASDTDFSLGNMLASQLLTQQDNSGAKAILAKLQFAPVVDPILKLHQGVLQLKAGDDNGLAILEQITKQAAEQKNKLGSMSQLSEIAFIMALADTGSISKAIIQAKKWQQVSPKNTDAMNILALLYQKNREPENAAVWYQKALDNDPDNIPSILFYAYQAASKGDEKRAGDLFIRVLALKPNHSRAFAGLLRLTLQVTETPNWQLIQSLIDLRTPVFYKNNNVLLMLTQSMYQAQAYEELHQYLRDNTEQKYWSSGLWRLWLQTQLARKDEETFNDALNKFNRLYSDNASQLFVIALLEKAKRFETILNVIELYGKQKSSIGKDDNGLLYAKAFALLSLHKIQQAEFLITRLKAKKTLPALNWLQGQLALLKNDAKSAQTFFEVHFDQQPTLPGLMQLAPLYINHGAIEKLVKLGESYLDEFSNDSHASMLLSQWLIKKDNSAAISFLDRPQNQKFIAQNWQVANNLAWLYLNSDNKQRALTFSNLAIVKQPQHKEVAFTHAIALLHNGFNDNALSVLKRIKQPNVDVRQLIAQLQKN